jgi:hypothetical protein
MEIRELLSGKKKQTAESIVEEARAILDREGAERAVTYLRDSRFADSPEVLVLARHIVYKHHGLSESLLGEPFLDQIWSECRACGFVWVEPLSQTKEPLNGLQCTKCERVFCANCIGALETRQCPCGGSLQRVVHVPGRARAESYEETEPEWPMEPPTHAERDMSLLFGYEDKIPIAIDPSLKCEVGSSADRLNWVEMLIDANLYYHAQQQLDCLAQSDAQSAKAKWLRARLLIVKLTNARERSRRKIGSGLRAFISECPPRIKILLQEAVAQEPSLGQAWLTAAEFYLDLADPPEYANAAACAERARELLGDGNRMLLILGRALRATGQPDKAASVLSVVSSDSAEAPLAATEKELADMERLTSNGPPDPVSSWSVGKHLIDGNAQDRARQIFEHLVAELPGRPEGYCGLARIEFLRKDISNRERLRRAHELCSKALACAPEFAPAHEFMGTLLMTASSSGIEVSGPLSPLGHFKRALELDSRCDVALAALADDCIEKRDAKNALGFLESAVKLDTKLDGVYFKLAVFYQALRQPEKERDAHRRAKALAPQLELATDYKNRILDICGFEY